MPPSFDLSSFLLALPKVELHIHLLGAASMPAVLELARRHPDLGVPLEEEELADFYASATSPTSSRSTAQSTHW